MGSIFVAILAGICSKERGTAMAMKRAADARLVSGKEII